MKRRSAVGWIGSVIVLSSGTLHAQTADPRVGPKLKEAAIENVVDKDGDYRIEYKIDDSRTQLVFVASKTEKVGDGLEVREIWSPAMKFAGVIDPQAAADVLERTATQKIGAFDVRPFKGEKLLVFCVRVPAELGAADFKTLVKLVAETADEREKTLTAKDDL
jgi:hypothetical protein